MDGGSKIKVKHYLLIIILLITILINIILLNHPISISTDRPVTQIIPVSYWIMLFVTCSAVTILVIKTDNKMLLVSMASVVYFLVLSYTFFYRSNPLQSDISSTGYALTIIQNSDVIRPDYFYYFEFPIFFIYSAFLEKFFDITIISHFYIGFFSLYLIIPVLLILLIHNRISNNKFVYFFFPIFYLFLIRYFSNLQYVPQMLGLIYLIITVGMYIKLQENRHFIYYILTFYFYILCIFTHPFIFIFFPLGIIAEKIIRLILKATSSKKLRTIITQYDSISDYISHNFKDYNNLIKNIKGWIKDSYIKTLNILRGRSRKTTISVILLFILYYLSYVFFFSYMRNQFDFISSSEGRGGSWLLISSLLGSKTSAGIIGYSTYPLFFLNSKFEYLFFRMSVVLMIFIIISIITYGIFSMKRRSLFPFDFFFSIGSLFFIAIGFITPAILGQRSLQATFLTIPKYITEVFQIRWIKIITLTITALIPIFFTINVCINDSLTGSMFLEDNGTIEMGIFFNENGIDNSTVVSPDRILYPIVSSEGDEERFNRITPFSFINQEENLGLEFTVLQSPKLTNRMYFFGVEREQYIMNQSIIFSQGNSKIYYCYNISVI